MATYRDLLKRLNWYVDDTVDDAIALMLFNQANEDLSPVAGYVQTKEATYLKTDPSITLPPDFFDMIELKIQRTTDTGFYRVRPINLVQPEEFYSLEYDGDGEKAAYELVGDQITLRPVDQSQDGTLLLRYYAMLPEITDLDQNPILKFVYNDAYPLFAAAKWWQNYQDEQAAKNDFWGEYQLKRSDLEKETKRWKEKTKSKSVYQFRPWA